MSGFRTRRETDSLLWTAPEHSVSIEAPWGILEEINGCVLEGFRRLSRGGIEVGGVLFGRRHDQIVRVHAWRPLPCEHSRGPAFLLSNADKQGLIHLLESAERDPQLQVLEPVGWFVSHTRAGVAMTEEDADIFQRHFPDPRHFTLVVHPQKIGPSLAGFFLRDPQGRLRTEASPREFSIEGSRMPQPPAATATGGSEGSLSAAPQQQRSARRQNRTPETPETVPQAAASVPHTLPTATSSSSSASPWRVLAVAAALLVFALALFAVPKLRTPSSPAAGLNLRLVDAEGQLRIVWDSTHPALEEADSAVVYIHDAGPNTPVNLDRDAARSGSLTYLRLSEDVKVRLVLQRDNQPVMEELARYVGPPLPKAGARALGRARDNRERYLLETKALREQLKKEIERTRTLEKAVRDLESQIRKEERVASTRSR